MAKETKERQSEIMVVKDGAIFPSARISQQGVGEIEIDCMAFASYLGKIEFTHIIRVRGAETTTSGREIIFSGTLSEFIEVVNKGIETEEMRIQWAGDFCRCEGWTEPR